MHKQISTRGEMKPFASRNQSVKQLSQIVSHITTEGYFQGFSLMASTVFCRPVHSPQSTVHSPQSTVHSPQSTVHSPQSTVHSPQSTVSQSTVHSPQSTVHSPQSTPHRRRFTSTAIHSGFLLHQYTHQ